MSFDEAWRNDPAGPEGAEASAAPRAPVHGRPRSHGLEAAPSVELQAALLMFGARARSLRAGVPRGSPTPAVEQGNWREVSAAVDAFLDRTAAETSSYDLVRARATLEAELEFDEQTYGDFPPAFAERTQDQVTELAVRMAQVRLLGVRTRHGLAAFEWPLEPVVVTSLFGRRLHPLAHVYRPHNGVDLAAQEGQMVNAASAGIVLSAGWQGAYGQAVMLQHEGGVATRYGHLSQVFVEPGDQVERGDSLGLAGNTGVSTGPHLHFEIVRDGRPRDPLAELGPPLPSEGLADSSTDRPGAAVGGPQ